jgi:glycosyltransferase involved in cell wall biosynthesis
VSQKPLKKRLYLVLGGRRHPEGASVVHCTAEAERSRASRRFGRTRSAVVPNLIGLGPYAEPPDPAEAIARWPALGKRGAKVLFLGRLHASKGLSIPIDAVGAVRRAGCPAHRFIAGTGERAYTEEMQARAAAVGLAEHCTWTGFVDGQLKRSLYAACDLFALPTSQENFSFAFFEALASGTAVVTTDQVDTREELARSGGALIVPQSTDAFAAAIREFVEGRRDASAMGRAGRAWALAELATDRVAAQFESLYRGS